MPLAGFIKSRPFTFLNIFRFFPLSVNIFKSFAIKKTDSVQIRIRLFYHFSLWKLIIYLYLVEGSHCPVFIAFLKRSAALFFT